MRTTNMKKTILSAMLLMAALVAVTLLVPVTAYAATPGITEPRDPLAVAPKVTACFRSWASSHTSHSIQRIGALPLAIFEYNCGPLITRTPRPSGEFGSGYVPITISALAISGSLSVWSAIAASLFFERHCPAEACLTSPFETSALRCDIMPRYREGRSAASSAKAICDQIRAFEP